MSIKFLLLKLQIIFIYFYYPTIIKQMSSGSSPNISKWRSSIKFETSSEMSSSQNTRQNQPSNPIKSKNNNKITSNQSKNKNNIQSPNKNIGSDEQQTSPINYFQSDAEMIRMIAKKNKNGKKSLEKDTKEGFNKSDNNQKPLLWEVIYVNQQFELIQKQEMTSLNEIERKIQYQKRKLAALQTLEVSKFPNKDSFVSANSDLKKPFSRQTQNSKIQIDGLLPNSFSKLGPPILKKISSNKIEQAQNLKNKPVIQQLQKRNKQFKQKQLIAVQKQKPQLQQIPMTNIIRQKLMKSIASSNVQSLTSSKIIIKQQIKPNYKNKREQQQRILREVQQKKQQEQLAQLNKRIQLLQSKKLSLLSRSSQIVIQPLKKQQKKYYSNDILKQEQKKKKLTISPNINISVEEKRKSIQNNLKSQKISNDLLNNSMQERKKKLKRILDDNDNQIQDHHSPKNLNYNHYKQKNIINQQYPKVQIVSKNKFSSTTTGNFYVQPSFNGPKIIQQQQYPNNNLLTQRVPLMQNKFSSTSGFQHFNTIKDPFQSNILKNQNHQFLKKRRSQILQSSQSQDQAADLYRKSQQSFPHFQQNQQKLEQSRSIGTYGYRRASDYQDRLPPYGGTIASKYYNKKQITRIDQKSVQQSQSQLQPDYQNQEQNKRGYGEADIIEEDEIAQDPIAAQQKIVRQAQNYLQSFGQTKYNAKFGNGLNPLNKNYQNSSPPQPVISKQIRRNKNQYLWNKNKLDYPKQRQQKIINRNVQQQNLDRPTTSSSQLNSSLRYAQKIKGLNWHSDRTEQQKKLIGNYEFGYKILPPQQMIKQQEEDQNIQNQRKKNIIKKQDNINNNSPIRSIPVKTIQQIKQEVLGKQSSNRKIQSPTQLIQSPQKSRSQSKIIPSIVKTVNTANIISSSRLLINNQPEIQKKKSITNMNQQGMLPSINSQNRINNRAISLQKISPTKIQNPPPLIFASPKNQKTPIPTPMPTISYEPLIPPLILPSDQFDLQPNIKQNQQDLSIAQKLILQSEAGKLLKLSAHQIEMTKLLGQQSFPSAYLSDKDLKQIGRKHFQIFGINDINLKQNQQQQLNLVYYRMKQYVIMYYQSNNNINNKYLKKTLKKIKNAHKLKQNDNKNKNQQIKFQQKHKNKIVVVWYLNIKRFYIGQWAIINDNTHQKTKKYIHGEPHGWGIDYIPQKYLYVGKFIQGIRNGFGKYKNLFLKESYQGYFNKGLKSQFGIYISFNERYEGEWKLDKKDGKGILLNQGDQYKGNFICDLKNGIAIQNFLNGDRYEGQYFNGKFSGHGFYKWNNGSTYQGQFYNGLRNGLGTWTYMDQIYEGHYINDKKSGHGKYRWGRFNCQTYYQGEFLNDFKHGKGRMKLISGQIIQEIWQRGQCKRYGIRILEGQVYKESSKQKRVVRWRQQQQGVGKDMIAGIVMKGSGWRKEG